MRPIKIITDSCSDLPLELREKYDISYLKFSIINKGKEISADLDWEEIKVDELYDTLISGRRLFTLPSTEQNIKSMFYKYAAEGNDIIYIGAPAVLSKTLAKANKVKAEVLEKYPDARIEVIDALNASIGQGIVVVKACEEREAGKSFDEIVACVNKVRYDVVEYVAVDSLTYLSKANKIKPGAAMLGNLFHIKPVLTANHIGEQVSAMNIKGRDKSIDKIVELFANDVVDPSNQDIYIIEGVDMDTAELIIEKLEAKGIHPKEFKIIPLGSVVGITTGPGTVGIFGLGKTRNIPGDTNEKNN